MRREDGPALRRVSGTRRDGRAGPATGLVVGAQRRRYAVELDDGATLDCVLKGRAMTPVCGDRVDVALDAAGATIVAANASVLTMKWRTMTLRGCAGTRMNARNWRA